MNMKLRIIKESKQIPDDFLMAIFVSSELHDEWKMLEADTYDPEYSSPGHEDFATAVYEEEKDPTGNYILRLNKSAIQYVLKDSGAIDNTLDIYKSKIDADFIGFGSGDEEDNELEKQKVLRIQDELLKLEKELRKKLKLEKKLRRKLKLKPRKRKRV